jgi:hypothetical protein
MDADAEATPVKPLRVGPTMSAVFMAIIAGAAGFAVEIAGAPALLGALEAMGACGPAGAVVHNRWTTHGTWEERSAWIRERGR